VFRKQLRRFIKPHHVASLKVFFSFNRRISRLIGLEFFALNGIDKQLDAIMDKSFGFYVELGANDGVSQSNTLFFERFKNWSGILIEPHFQTFERLIKNRSDSNFFKNAACVSSTYKKNDVELAFSHLMTTAIGVETDLDDPFKHAECGSEFWRGDVYTFVAPALKLSDILDEANVPLEMDLLSLDVEGAELEVLRGLDHSRHRFNYICVESRDFVKLNEFLNENDYCFHSKISTHDYLFENCG
jgi:FkbM family methyltransferase